MSEWLNETRKLFFAYMKGCLVLLPFAVIAAIIDRNNHGHLGIGFIAVTPFALSALFLMRKRIGL